MADAVYVIGRSTGPFFIGTGPADQSEIARKLHPDLRGKDYELWVGRGLKPDETKIVHMLTVERASHFLKDKGWYGAPLDGGVECARWAYDAITDPLPPWPDYGAALTKLREEMGLGGPGLAHLLGIDRSIPRRLENGQLQMTLEHYARLRWWCQRLGYSARFEELFPLAGDVLPEHAGSITPGKDAA